MRSTKLNKKIITYLIIASLLLILLPTIFRAASENEAIPGRLSYEHLERAEQPGLNPFYLMLNAFSSEKAASITIPLVLSIISIALFIAISVKIKMKKNTAIVATILLAASPVFAYSSFIITPFALSLTLNLAIFLLLLTEKKLPLAAAMLLMLINALIGPQYAIITLLVVATYCLMMKRQISSVLAAAVTLIASLFVKSSAYVKVKDPATQLFSDFGALIGFGMLEFVLIIIGIFISWKNKQKLAFVYILCLALFIFSIFVPEAKIMVMPIFAVFIALFFIKIYERKWQIKIIKTLSIIILICGIVFSNISYVNRAANTEPDNEMVKSLEWIRENTKQESRVFSAQQNEQWIRHVAERTFVPVNEKDTETIYYSRNLAKTSEVLDNNEIEYIWIDTKTKEALLAKEEKGLLFLFTNNETFKKQFSNNNTEIWRYYSNKNII